MKRGLLGNLIDKSSNELSDIDKLQKIKKSETIHIGKNNSIETKLAVLEQTINKILGKYKNQVDLITNIGDLKKYIDVALEQGVVAIDTETVVGELGKDALDTVTCELAGVCLYTPTQKSVYIPVNHIDMYTLERLSNQVSFDDLKEQLLRLNGIKQIYHNAKYDLKVLHWYLGIDLVHYWDTQIAAQLINEIESHELKYLYSKYIEHREEKEYDFNSLFKSIDYRMVPPKIASLYAATDAYITYKLYEYQLTMFNTEDFTDIKNVMLDIEMPVLSAIMQMENNGISLDTNMANELSIKNHKLLDEKYEEFVKSYEPYNQKIQAYLEKNKDNKLKLPININSPIQLAILLYDIMGLVSPDKKKPRGTGIEIIETFKDSVSKAILNYRKTSKLLTTYIDKLPNEISKRTGRIHANFNQYGAKTGRLSSDNPNLQNIPHDDTRQLFYASDGYLLVGSDFSLLK